MDSEGFIIREAKITDKEAIGEVYNSAISQGDGYSKREEKLLEFQDNEPMERLYTSNSTYVAESDNKVIGWCSLYPEKQCVDGLFVHPNYQSNGIGSELLQSVEEEALDQNMLKIWIASDVNVVDYYVERGYAVVEETNMEAVNSDEEIPCVILVKSLHSKIAT